MFEDSSIGINVREKGKERNEIFMEWESEPRKMLIWGVETQKDTKQEGSTFVHTYYTITYCTIFWKVAPKESSCY